MLNILDINVVPDEKQSVLVNVDKSIHLKLLTQLLKRLGIDEELFYSVFDQLKSRISELNKDQIYISKKLCGKDFWMQLTKGDKIAAGRCISIMSERNLLPLVYMGRNPANASMYRLM